MVSACPVCKETFDCESRRPKCLPCGHSLCLACLQHTDAQRTCPLDRKAFSENPENLPDNYAVVDYVKSVPHGSADAAALRFGCRVCKSEATEACALAGHGMCPLSALRPGLSRVTTVLGRLQRAVAADCSVAELLDSAPQDLQQQLEAARGPQRTEQERRQAALRTLQAAASEPQAAPGDLEKAVAKAAQLTESLKMERLEERALLTHCKARWSVLLKAESGATWRASLKLDKGQCHPVRCLLLLLQDQGHLTRVGSIGASVTESDCDVSAMSKSKTPSQEMVEFLRSERVQEVHKLTGLSCTEHPGWALMLLRAVSPRLEELQLHNANLEHLEALRSMLRLRILSVNHCEEDAPGLPPQLEEVDVDRISHQQLLSMADMPALRKLRVVFPLWKSEHALPHEVPDFPMQLEELEAHNIGDPHLTSILRLRHLRTLKFGCCIDWTSASFPPTNPSNALSSLQSLRVFDNRALHAVAAFAAAVVLLEIDCNYSHSFPLIVEALKACRLPALRRVVLMRNVSRRCDDWSCRREVRELWNILLREEPTRTGRTTDRFVAVQVLCSFCNALEVGLALPPSQ